MTRNSPSPWYYVAAGAGIWDAKGELVGKAARHWEPGKGHCETDLTHADGTLMAAAAELEQACRHALQLLWVLSDAEDAAGRHNAALNMREVEATLTAAIAKARPEVVG